MCTTEIIAFAKLYPEFKKRDCELLGLSVDSVPSHLAWINDIHRATGIEIPFPIISDLNMKVSNIYNMIAPNSSTTQTIRSVFIIDPNQKIRAILQYPMQVGRNTTEILRLLDCLQTCDSKEVVTPANWLPGQATIVPSPKTYNELIQSKTNMMGYNCMDWYLCFKDTMPSTCMGENNFNNTCNINSCNNIENGCNCNCMNNICKM